MVDKTSIQKAVKTALEKAPERKFKESVDITVNLRNIDMSQPKNRIDETILLPNGFDNVKIAVLGKGDITLLSDLRRSSGSGENPGKHVKWRKNTGSSLLRRQ